MLRSYRLNRKSITLHPRRQVRQHRFLLFTRKRNLIGELNIGRQCKIRMESPFRILERLVRTQWKRRYLNSPLSSRTEATSNAIESPASFCQSKPLFTTVCASNRACSRNPAKQECRSKASQANPSCRFYWLLTFPLENLSLHNQPWSVIRSGPHNSGQCAPTTPSHSSGISAWRWNHFRMNVLPPESKPNGKNILG